MWRGDCFIPKILFCVRAFVRYIFGNVSTVSWFCSLTWSCTAYKNSHICIFKIIRNIIYYFYCCITYHQKFSGLKERTSQFSWVESVGTAKGLLPRASEAAMKVSAWPISSGEGSTSKFIQDFTEFMSLWLCDWAPKIFTGGRLLQVLEATRKP